MDGQRDFNLNDSPLEKTNLIEAGAGTGKTFAIEGIFLRLLLEKRLSVSEILVVTYTTAATEELRDRIRKKIRAAHDAFTRGGSTETFLDKIVKNSGRPERAMRILKTALRNFDEAPIYTIHSFCMRVLQENAFESLGLFDTELVPDERTLMEEIVRDFWRIHFYNAPVELVSYALTHGYSPEMFMKLTRGLMSNPEMNIVPETADTDLEALEAFRTALGRVRSAWPSCREAVLEKLNDPGLNRTRYKNPDALVAQMDGYLEADVSVPLFDAFDKFTVSGLKAGTKNKFAAPEHPFFEDCEALKDRAEALADQIEGKLLYLKTELFRYVRRELPKRKRIRNIQFYDDLLVNLKSVLEKPGGVELRDHLRKRYRAALIDEFQDTDPIQYAIFRTVFGGGTTPLFLIGDPKQSIYSFRGADLFAYMKAARHCDHGYTLNRNWRSEPGLIDAVNAVFVNPGKAPFLYEDIRFSGAVAADVADRPCLTVDGQGEAPFHLWYAGSDRLEAAGAKGNKQRTGDLIIEACAGEIARLLRLGAQGRARIGQEALAAQHLAVLVRTHSEARLVRDALAALGVPCVLHSLGNLFDTHEAQEMKRLLAAIEDSRAGGLIRAALATDMLGIKGEELAALTESENGMDPWIERFCDYRERWERFGYMEMFRGFMTREKVRERLLAFPDGERRLTNVLHLMEVLHTESVESSLAVPGLMKWLERQMDPATLRLEEHELRLESDARAVRIVTIHKSKGLEYPVVFCPFNWGGSTLKGDAFTYHDPEADWRLNLVMAGGDPAMEALAEKEQLAENIRLLYVALTRARNRGYLVWGPFKDAGASALAYVLHPPAGGDGGIPDIVAATDSAFQNLSDTDIRADLAGMAAEANGAIQVYDMPLPGEKLLMPPPMQAEPMACRVFKGVIDTDRRIASFSYLIHDRTAAPVLLPLEGDAALTELPDHDSRTDRPAPLAGEEPAGILAFERGSQAGNFFHEILERVDFSGVGGGETHSIVDAALKKYGYDLSWREAVFTMIRNVVYTPLHDGFGGLSLSTVKREQRISEMGFYFPLKRLTREGLQRIFRESGLSDAGVFPQQMERLTFQPVRGFMKGFMDLVFQHDGRYYLCDWKSNYLGPNVSDYGMDVLQEEMAAAFYLLQYHLYLVALNRYLTLKDPGYEYDRNFGGVFYIFLRGLDGSTGGKTGIFYDRPSKETIDILSKGLMDET